MLELNQGQLQLILVDLSRIADNLEKLAEISKDEAIILDKIAQELTKTEQPASVDLVLLDTQELWVSLEGGYGTAVKKDDPILKIDWYYDKPVLYVWADINQEEPTHIISLVGAKDELYDENNLSCSGTFYHPSKEEVEK